MSKIDDIKDKVNEFFESSMNNIKSKMNQIAESPHHANKVLTAIAHICSAAVLGAVGFLWYTLSGKLFLDLSNELKIGTHNKTLKRDIVGRIGGKDSKNPPKGRG